MTALPPFGARPPARDPHVLVREILQQARFRAPVPAPSGHRWWDALWGWISDRWDRLIAAFAHRVHIGAVAGIALGDVLIAGCILLVLAVAIRLLVTMARESGTANAMPAGALPSPADAAQLYQAALQAAQQGAYALAIARIFRAALTALDARGVLRDDPARTVNECRSDVRRRIPHLRVPFDRLAAAFTAAVYAEDRMTAAQWADAQDAYRALS